MKLVLLIIATFFVVTFFIASIKGNKYDEYVENLDGNEYPLKELYGIGFAMQDFKPLQLSGSLYIKLTNQSKMIYEPMYAEYYAKLTWAQVLTFVWLSLTMGFALAAMLGSAIFALFGVLVAVVFGYYFMSSLKAKLEKRQEAANLELPEIVSSVALLMNAGMVINDAWKRVAYSSDGEIYDLMKKVCEEVDNGVSFKIALGKFGTNSNSQEVKKFSSALSQSLDKGNRDLCNFLTNQSSEMLILKKQHMLQKGEAAASKLLIPIGIIFVGIIIVVLAAVVGIFTGSSNGLLG